MAAGLGFKTFTTGEVLTAGDVNGYLMQGINVFATTAARDAAITAPAEGQFAFTKDTNGLWYYDGAAWVASGATGDIEGVTAGVGISGGGTSGTVTVTNSMATAIDAKGDLVPGTGADTFARLAVGANDTVLTADSSTATGLKWAAPATSSGPMFSAYMDNSGNNQVPANNTFTKVIMDTEQFDTDSCYNTSTYRFTPNKAGYYLFTYGMNSNTNTPSGNRIFVVYKNGAEQTAPYVRGWQGGLAVDTGTVSGSVIFYANGTTDYFEMFGLLQDATSRRFNTSANSGATFWQAVWMRS